MTRIEKRDDVLVVRQIMLVPAVIGGLWVLIGLVTILQPHRVVQGATSLGIGLLIMAFFTRVRTTTATKAGMVSLRVGSVLGSTSTEEQRAKSLRAANVKDSSGRKWWVILTCVVDEGPPIQIVREASSAYARDLSPALRAQFDEIAAFLQVPIDYRVD